MGHHELVHRRRVTTFVCDPGVVYLVRPFPIDHQQLVRLERRICEAHHRLEQVPKAVLDVLAVVRAVGDEADADDVQTVYLVHHRD